MRGPAQPTVAGCTLRIHQSVGAGIENLLGVGVLRRLVRSFERAPLDVFVHFRDAARACGTASRGDQRRSVRMLLQVLSLATTDPDTCGCYARTPVEVMLDPISEALVSVGYSRADARLRATLIVSGLRGLCQNLLVTGRRSRVDAAAELLIKTTVE